MLVVGGGINGTGVARDAASRGFSVILCEKDDLASHTSSASTKLVHGGLRYLEHFEFGLVRKALLEREVLLRSAPHVISPLRFVMVHDPAMRPAWMIRLGIFLYDHLARRKVLPDSESIRLRSHPAGVPLRPEFTRGFAYSDGWVDDARLVVLNALDAANRGALVLTRTRCVHAERDGARWRATLESDVGERINVDVRALVNATGPWAATFLQEGLGRPSSHGLRLVKGSHIIVPKIFQHSMAYLFQSADGRIIFAIPYEEDFTLVGTTEVDYHGDPGVARISDIEIDYLCEITGRYFARPVSPGDVVWSYSGVRPLLDDESSDPSSISRDYMLELDASGAPLLTVWGGKITTFRRLGEDAVDTLLAALGQKRRHRTHDALLPGGDLSEIIGAPRRPDIDIKLFIERMTERLPYLDPALVRRYARSYGSCMLRMLAGVKHLADMGRQIAPHLYEVELRHLVEREWARTADDVLWRRTKLGLHMTPVQRDAVRDWMHAHVPAAKTPIACATQ